jgi:hypothetical protein
MALHPATTAKRRQKDPESYNGCPVDFAVRNAAVEKRGQRVSGERHHPTTPRTRKRKRNSPFTPAEFWQYVDRRGPDECWPWTDTVLARTGYGMFWHPELKRTLPAHRVAWLVTHGVIPRGFEVMHRCDNPVCQNIERHLCLGTHRDNMADMAAKGRADNRAALRRLASVRKRAQRTLLPKQLNQLVNRHR